jgi:hypothetical protein
MGYQFVVLFIDSFMDDVTYVRDGEVCTYSMICYITVHFPHLSRPVLGPTQPPVHIMGTGFLPGIKSGRGVKLTPHPF